MQFKKEPFHAVATVVLLTALVGGCKSGGPSTATPDLAAASSNVSAEPTYPDVRLASRSSTTSPVSHRAEQASSATVSSDFQFCPVTGAMLGSMGEPIAVDIAGQSVYVCCAGCVEKLRRNPGKYLQPLKSGGASPRPGDSGSSCGSTSGNCGSHRR